MAAVLWGVSGTMWDMESNVFEISQVVIFLCCPSPTHFLPCQFLEPVSIPTSRYGPVSELLIPLLLVSLSQGCLLSGPKSAPLLFATLLLSIKLCASPSAPCSSFVFTLLLPGICFFHPSSDIQEIWRSTSSLAERVWTGSFFLQEGVWERHQLRGAVKDAVLLLGAASWVLPGRAGAPGRG